MSGTESPRDAVGTRHPFAVRGRVLGHIREERARQDEKWGGVPGLDRRDDHTYAAVLTEEVGEACQAWLKREVAQLREELVQVAAVAVAWIEELDNGGMQPRPGGGDPCGICGGFEMVIPRGWHDEGSPFSTCANCGGPDA